MDDSTRNLFSVNINRYIGYNSTIRITGVFDQGAFAKACKKRWCYIETFNTVRDIIFGNYLVTKTNPMELNKRRRHWNWSRTISMILCFTAWITVAMCHVYFIGRNEGSAFPNVLLTLRIHSWHFENSTLMRYILLQTVYSCKYYVFIFCKYCSLVSIMHEYETHSNLFPKYYFWKWSMCTLI
jgi:hypothetical protein